MSSDDAYQWFITCIARDDIAETRNDVIARDERVQMLTMDWFLTAREIADDILALRLDMARKGCQD